jgi:hypothetical protein
VTLEHILVTLALASAGLTGLLFVITHRMRLPILAFFVGVSASFVAVQVAHVHIFTVAVLIFALVSRERRAGLKVAGVILMGSTVLVSITALTGQLVTNRGLALQLIAFGATSLLLCYRASNNDFRTISTGLLIGISASSAVSVLQVGGVLPYALFGHAAFDRPAGLYPEPDWLGMMGAIGVVLAWTSRMRPIAQSALLLLNVVAVVLSSARAALVALAVVAAFSAFAAITRRRLQRRPGMTKRSNRATLPVLVLAAAVAGVVVALPEESNLLVSRMLSAFNSADRDSAASVRLLQLAGLQSLAESAPWYGWGLSSSGRISGYGVLLAHSSDAVGSAGTNWVISLWADAKLLAIPLIAVVGALSIRGAWRGTPVLLLVLVYSLFSNTFFFPITWVGVAMALAIEGRQLDRISPPLPDVQGGVLLNSPSFERHR